MKRLRHRDLSAEDSDWEGEDKENEAEEAEQVEIDTLQGTQDLLCTEEAEIDVCCGCDEGTIDFIALPCGHMLCHSCSNSKYCNNCSNRIVKFDRFSRE